MAKKIGHAVYQAKYLETYQKVILNRDVCFASKRVVRASNATKQLAIDGFT